MNNLNVFLAHWRVTYLRKKVHNWTKLVRASADIAKTEPQGAYTSKNLTTCSKSANKPSTSCVRTACYKLLTSLEQAVNNLQQPC